MITMFFILASFFLLIGYYQPSFARTCTPWPDPDKTTRGPSEISGSIGKLSLGELELMAKREPTSVELREALNAIDKIRKFYGIKNDSA